MGLSEVKSPLRSKFMVKADKVLQSRPPYEMPRQISVLGVEQGLVLFGIHVGPFEISIA